MIENIEDLAKVLDIIVPMTGDESQDEAQEERQLAALRTAARLLRALKPQSEREREIRDMHAQYQGVRGTFGPIDSVDDAVRDLLSLLDAERARADMADVALFEAKGNAAETLRETLVRGAKVNADLRNLACDLAVALREIQESHWEPAHDALVARARGEGLL